MTLAAVAGLTSAICADRLRIARRIGASVTVRAPGKDNTRTVRSHAVYQVRQILSQPQPEDKIGVQAPLFSPRPRSSRLATTTMGSTALLGRRLFSLGFICSSILLLETGCAYPGKATLQRDATNANMAYTVSGFLVREKDQPALFITDTNILDYFAGRETNGCVLVSYSADLHAHATLFARLTDRALVRTTNQLGLTMTTRPHFYLLHLPGERRSLHYSLSMPDRLATLPWLMPLTNELAAVDASQTPRTEALLANLCDAPLSLFLMTHELYELRLINPGNPLVLPDFQGRWLFLHWTFKYHTRWFREGYASYAGDQADRAYRAQVAQLGIEPSQVDLRGNFLLPFSKLAKVRTRLFDWNQNSPASMDQDHYEAALGLMLLLEQRYGPCALAAVMRALPRQKHPDGPALLCVFQEIAGADLQQLTKDFQWPDHGLTLTAGPKGRLELKELQHGSVAAKSGLCVGDVIIEVNGSPLVDAIDYELRLLQLWESLNDLILTVERRTVRLPRFP